MIQFGIKAQAFLIADPTNGDKTQADYYSRVVALTAMINSQRQDPNKVFHSHVINKNSQYTYGGASYYGSYVNDTYNEGKSWNQVIWSFSYLQHDLSFYFSSSSLIELNFTELKWTFKIEQLLNLEWDKICPDQACSGIYFNALTSSQSNNFQSVPISAYINALIDTPPNTS